ncbi:MAG: NAD(P)-dependent oxidoreductase [Armatimonadetes bacterium]|nr:NAD(P)-dependent oxidoreductase [Armatimonadota bacterium]
MKIALTGAGSPLGAELAAAIQAEHELVVLDPEPAGGEHRPVADYDLETLTAALEGVDAAIHAAVFHPVSTRGLAADQAWLDVAGRGTYNLLQAGAKQELKRVVHLGSLELLGGYDPDLYITESYRALPTDQPRDLAFHLAEQVCFECSRELEPAVVVLRLGRLVRAEEVAGLPFDPLWPDPRDAAAVAVKVASTERGQHRRWHHVGLVHVCASRPDAFSQSRILQRWLEFSPEHIFAACPPVEVHA